MKTLDKVMNGVVPAPKGVMENKPGYASAQAGGSGGRERARGHVDAINQVFAEFAFAYHNQFHKAYPDAESLAVAKKYWLTCLADFSPEVIAQAARHLVKHHEYLPSVAALVTACENAFPLFGLPPAEAAYREACLRPEPKAEQPWSHPAVYHAGRATGWFALASEPQAAILPTFEYNYQQLCQRVVRGESLSLDVPKALPETVAAPLSPEENKAKLAALRRRFDL